MTNKSLVERAKQFMECPVLVSNEAIVELCQAVVDAEAALKMCSEIFENNNVHIAAIPVDGWLSKYSEVKDE